MATRSVTGKLIYPDGTPAEGEEIIFRMKTGMYSITVDETYPGWEKRYTADATGAFTATLVAGTGIVYEVVLPDGQLFLIAVESGGATTLEDLRAATSVAPVAIATVQSVLVSLGYPGTAPITVENNDVSVVAGATILDFSSSFVVTNSPTGEANISPSFGTGAANIAAGNHGHVRAISYMFGDGTSVLTVGVQKRDLYIPSGMVVTPIEWTLLVDPAGALVMTAWGDTYANHPPTVADLLTGSAPPTVTATNLKGQSATLTGWTTPWTGPLVVRFNVVSVTNVTSGSLTLKASVVG